MGVFPQQKPEEGGFSPAVPADEAQLPAVVDLEGGVVKDGVRTAGVGKGQVLGLNHRHTRQLLAVGPDGSPAQKIRAAGKLPRPCTARRKPPRDGRRTGMKQGAWR